MKIRALPNVVIVEPILRVPEKTDSGIFIPETTKQGPPIKGAVISVGSGVEEVKVGDVVHFKERIDFTSYKLEGVVYFNVPKEDLLAVEEA